MVVVVLAVVVKIMVVVKFVVNVRHDIVASRLLKGILKQRHPKAMMLAKTPNAPNPYPYNPNLDST